MTHKAITVVGSSNMDLVVLSPRIPAKGETILGTDFFMVPGGKGANQAVAAAKLGATVFFVAKLGDDAYGVQSLHNFTKAGINPTYITQTQEAPSGTALITVDQKGNNSIVVVPGANHCLTVNDVDRAEEAIRNSGVVVCQLEIPIDVVEHTSKLAKKYSVPFILDPAPAPHTPLSAILLKNTAILKPNETEAEIITGIKINDRDDAVMACKHILSRGVSTVILTMGAKGFILATGSDVACVPPITIEAVDSTAAGDAFTGGLAYYIAQGKPVLEAAKLANYVAALSVTRRGAQPSMPTLEEVKNLIQNNLNSIKMCHG